MKNAYTVVPQALPGVILIIPVLKRDERGFSANVYGMTDLVEFGITTTFVGDFVSHSKKGVVRGFHFQRAPYMQDKLVRVTYGEVFDVAADCDPTSPTYGQYVAATLRGDEQQMLYIPGKYAHGFCVTSDEAVVEYKLSDSYHPESVGGARHDDPRLGVKWPVSNLILSTKDRSWPPLP